MTFLLRVLIWAAIWALVVFVGGYLLLRVGRGRGRR